MIALTDLHPKWMGLLRPDSGEGLSFDCPKCGATHRLAVYFSNPIDGKPCATWQILQWLRTGDEFSTLTIEPSLQYPCFHGWIEHGQVINISESTTYGIALINGVQRLVALSPNQVKRALAAPAPEQAQKEQHNG